MQSMKTVSLIAVVLLLTSLASVSNAQSPTSGKLATLMQRSISLLAGAGLLAITCTGCGGKLVLDKKYDNVPGAVSLTSFAALIPLGILAEQEKVNRAYPMTAAGVFAASGIFAAITVFDYGEEGFHVKSGGVDWYGMNNDLYSERYILGIRMDGQQQFVARQHELDPYDYNRVLAHIQHQERDYAVIVKRPWKPRRAKGGPPYGLQMNIRIPSHTPPPPKPKVDIVDSLQPYEDILVPLDAVRGIYLTDHPDYLRDEWVVITEGEQLLYGKVTHHFSSNYAQVKILAVYEDGHKTMLPENDIYYSFYPHARLQPASERD